MKTAMDDPWQNIAAPWEASFAGVGPIQRLRFRPQASIYDYDAPFDGIFLITRGMVKNVVVMDRRSVISSLVLSGEILGFDSFQGGRYVTTAIATSLVETMWIPKESFFALITSAPWFRRQLDLALRQAVAESALMINLLTNAPIDVRVAYLLIKIYSRSRVGDGEKVYFDLGLSMEEMASYLGLRRQTVCRQLEEFRNAGMIDVVGRDVRMRDCDALRKVCGRIVIKF